MAEHIRNELARASVPVRPNRILTLAKFLDPFTDLQQAPESLVHLLIARFGPASEFPGFHRALAAIIQAPFADADALPNDLASLAHTIDDHLSTLGYALRDKRLRTANPIATGPIFFDGFFTFSPAELDFIAKFAAQTSVTITLPDWSGSSAAHDRLIAAGFTEQRLERPLRESRRTVFAATSLEQDVEQIALRILEHARNGRQFREMGILLRVRDPYASALESTLARFGIPARFHFTDAVSAHPAIQYLTGIVQALLSGWDHAALLTLLRMPVSGIGATPEGDSLDFALRDQLPNFGLNDFASGAANLTRLDPWKHERMTPADWSERLKTLRDLIPTPEISDQIDRDQLNIWRSTAAALEALNSALDATALAFDPQSRIPLSAFWPQVQAVLSIEKLRVPDHRRNVVNILDVYEARQWELPIVFVCGLTERQFPQYHREDPLLNDAACERAGLPTSTDRQQEEQFLFELATTRATEETVLSYARFNDRGDASLRSFFLEHEGQPVAQGRVFPKIEPTIIPQIAGTPVDLRKLHAKLAPTSIESFLQCPFQFFARKTLKLRQRPLKPRERLDPLLQGSILHKALAEYKNAPMFGASWIDRVFEDECRKNNIPATYRKEAVRLELLRHFEAFLADREWPLNWPSRTEQEFLIALTPELSIRGRIDRLDTGPGNQAIVIDYKYSAAARIRDHIKNNDAGNLVQGGLYLLAAERTFGLNPSGMFYCGLRQSVTWDGWHTNIPGLALGESRTSTALRELIQIAETKAIETFETIASGNIEVRPADRDKCRYCDFNDICRIESQSKGAQHERVRS